MRSFSAPGQPIPRPRTGNPHEDRFYDLAGRYLEQMMGFNPYVATYLGYHRYDHLMDDISAEGLAARLSFYEEARRSFARVDRRPLGVGASIDLDLITTDIESALFMLEELKPHEREPQFYNELIGYGLLYLTILEPGSPLWPERLEALLSRMRALPAFLRDARSNLSEPSLVATRFIIEQNPGNISFIEKVLPTLFEPHPALKEEFGRAQGAAVAALREYQRFLEEELTARSTGSWRLGRDLWTRKLSLTLQSDLTPEEIDRRARERLREERERMLELALPMHARLFPAHHHAEAGDDLINAVVKEVISEISRSQSSAERLLDDVRGMVSSIKEFVRGKDVITLPPESDNFVLEPTPAFLDGMAVAFFNPAPAFEPQLKKSYWISSIPKDKAESYLREYNIYGLRNLTIHEAVPGHYVQFYYALNSPIASIYKKVFASGTFAEGWAVLCEEQMYDLGYGEGDEDGGAAGRLVHRKMSLRAPINALLDARLHTGAGTEEEDDRWALDLMQRMGFQEEAEAAGKLRRAKVTSTQLSTYFVGFIELADLMEEYRAQKGPSFNPKEFNERLLSYGTIPPRAVRRLMLGG
jgi:uncharacterized protein (DUF885 family)